MNKPFTSAYNNQRLLIIFILAWILLNLLQAGLTNVDGDEAYYWMFARELDWGYFDHPPMVAISVKMGELFSHGSLFTRLGTVLFSAGSIFFGYKALPEYLRNVKLYILSFSSVIVFHVYGFIVTPDSCLLFFTALFFYAYRLYLQKQSLAQVVFLALSITGLLYSKYHGILPVLFVFLSNPKLVFKRSAWLVVVMVIVSFLPHLYWQSQNDWTTFRYHLLERIGSPYRIDKTTNYILSQLFVWGPLTTIPALVYFFRRRSIDVYLRAHYFNFFGILIFFFFNSFRSTIEPHWTLASGVSFIVLWLLALNEASLRMKKIMTRLMIANIFLLMSIRVLFAIPNSPFKNVLAFKAQMFGKSLADSVYKYASGTPVVFTDSYIFPSLYQYYHTREQTAGYSTVFSRKNYFSLSGDADQLNNRKVFIASGFRILPDDIEVANNYGTVYLHTIDRFRSLNHLKVKWDRGIISGPPGHSTEANIVISYDGAQEVDTKDLSVSYAFIKTKKEILADNQQVSIMDGVLMPGYRKQMKIKVVLPAKPGNYRLVFSIIQPPLAGTIASPFYDVEVE